MCASDASQHIHVVLNLLQAIINFSLLVPSTDEFAHGPVEVCLSTLLPRLGAFCWRFDGRDFDLGRAERGH